LTEIAEQDEDFNPQVLADRSSAARNPELGY
jgi:hypothetical protein